MLYVMARPFQRIEVLRDTTGSLVVRIDGERISPGNPLVFALAESFVDCLARAVTRGEATEGGVADGRILKAIALMQAEPGKRWTVERLARAVGLSRAAFARRFEAESGLTPLRYLTHYRMSIAAQLLRDSDMSLAEIAARVGYESEFAFSRAFKRHHGSPPGVFRRSAPAAVVSIRAAA
jgi:transcriptional regulator GlxA family with amidase domain